MTLTTHILGYPRIETKRELKFAEEVYWQDKIFQDELLQQAQQVELANLASPDQCGLIPADCRGFYVL